MLEYKSIFLHHAWLVIMAGIISTRQIPFMYPGLSLIVEILLPVLVRLPGLLMPTTLMGVQLRHPQFESKRFLADAQNQLFPQ
jgi:hypothetical protein